jgi:hypothetical protein
MTTEEAILAKILKLRSALVQRAVITNPNLLQMVILDIGDLTLEVKLAESRKKIPLWDISLKRNGQFVFITQTEDKQYFDYCTVLAQTWRQQNTEIGIQEFLRLV